VILDRADGGPVLRFDPEEAQLLSLLFDELTALLDDSDPDNDVLSRLTPSAYRNDPEAETEYRALTESSLRDQRDERIAACRVDLAVTGGNVELADPDTARRWLQVLNDLRLALGTRLGVTQDDDRDPDPEDPAAQPWLVYSWLTAVQDAVVHTQMP
jgi:hypothetical protein